MQPSNAMTNWRAFPRKVVYTPMHVISGRARLQATLIDVSLTGVRFTTQVSRPVGDVYQIEVRNQTGPAVFSCRILWDYFLDNVFVTGAEMLFESPEQAQLWAERVEEMPAADPEAASRVAIERRQQARRSTTRPILFRDRYCWVKGSFRDINEGGTGAQLVVYAEHQPPPRVHFRVQLDAQVSTFRGHVVWSRMVGGAYLLGLKDIVVEGAAITPAAGAATVSSLPATRTVMPATSADPVVWPDLPKQETAGEPDDSEAPAGPTRFASPETSEPPSLANLQPRLSRRRINLAEDLRRSVSPETSTEPTSPACVPSDEEAAPAPQDKP